MLGFHGISVAPISSLVTVTAVVVTDFGWFVSFDKPLVRKTSRLLIDIANPLSPPVIIATAIGYDWYTDANKVPVRKQGRSFIDTASPFFQNPFNLGWLTNENKPPIRKARRSYSDTTFQIATPVTSFAWFESFPQTRARKVRKYFNEPSFVNQEFYTVLNLGYAWFVQYPRPIQFYKNSTNALRNNSAYDFIATLTTPVIVPPVIPGTIQDLYHRPGTQKTKFWREVFAQGIRRGPPNVAGRIRR